MARESVAVATRSASVPAEAKVVLLDIHAEATSEKIASAGISIAG